MDTLEKLYHLGLISYPRTETDGFPMTMNLKEIISQFVNSKEGIGEFAVKLLDKDADLWRGPRPGKKDDKAHPPIYPLREILETDQLDSRHAKVFDFVLRHFLACVSKDAAGARTVVEIQVGEQSFTDSGLLVNEKNFLEVYPYDKWEAKLIPPFEQGQVLDKFEVVSKQDTTKPPSPLTEADLVSLLDKNGIGTDATMHTHIKTVKDRGYAKKSGIFIVPTNLGMTLVQVFQDVGVNLHQP